MFHASRDHKVDPRKDLLLLFSLFLRDGDDSLRVTYWSNVDEVLAVKPTPGAVLEIEGVVEFYQDKPQLKVSSGYKIQPVEAPPAADTPAEPVALSSLSAADKGRAVTVQGSLGAPRSLGKGTAYTLSDGEAAIDLVLWHSTVPDEVRQALAEGQRVSATGVVGEYEGQLQLKANPGASVQPLP